MLVIWLLLVCQSAWLWSVSCTQLEPPMHTRDVTLDKHNVYGTAKVPDDFKVVGVSRPEDGVNDVVHEGNPHSSHFSVPEYEDCLKSEDNDCNIQTSPSVEEDGEGIKEHSDEVGSPSSHGRKAKASSWFSDWDLAFSGKEMDIEEVSPDKSHSVNKESSVRVLCKKGDFERFMRDGHVVIVFFYKDVKSEDLQRFLFEYEVASDQLQQYGISLAMADCAVYSIGMYCNLEKVNRFAYGFREGQEKIAFPLDTLFNNNAIVASALHLDLINAVPILQTAGERRELEKRCKGRCDIIFSFQRTLGTYEHRMFLEIAHAYQDSYVFAITTYTAGTLGLADSLQVENDEEQRLWVVHCADKTPQQQCVVSHFRHKMLLPGLLRFIAMLQLPKWHDLDVSPSKNVVITPYDGTSLPWVILIYDSSCKHRVQGLAPDLGQLLHGSVATITLDLDKINEEALQSLGLERNKIVTPALAFLPEYQGKPALLNDYDDPLEWVNEQLSAIFEDPQSKEEMGYQPVQALEELRQDDEVVMGMQREETFMNVSPLNGQQEYSTAIKSNALTAIAFYLAWDPVSNLLLQHLNEIVPDLGKLGSQAVLHRVNCFDWPKLCDGLEIDGYPKLHIYTKNKQTAIYKGPIHSRDIIRTILLYENPPPLNLKNFDEMVSFLTLQTDLHPVCDLMLAAAVGIFSTKEDSTSFMEAAQVLKASHLTGRYISSQAVTDICSSDSGCILINKPRDLLQPRTLLESGLTNSSKIATFLRHFSHYVLAPLDFERLAVLSSVSGLEGSQSVTNQYLIVFFIPPESSLSLDEDKKISSKISEKTPSDGQKASHKDDANLSDSEEDIWTVVGRLATEFSEPGFVFSWIEGDEPLAEKLISVYQLTASDFNLVAVNWKHNQNEATKGKKDEQNGVHVYTCPDLTPQLLRPWLISLKEGTLKPSGMLKENDWEPLLPGFDYIKFMMEDEERDAEDQLMLEMESDLRSHSHHGEDEDGLLHFHKEL